MNFAGYNPRADPARNKPSYVNGSQPGYTGQVSAYNNWLYTPMDRRPTPAPIPYTPAPGNYASVSFPTPKPVVYTPTAPARGGAFFDSLSDIPTGSGGPSGQPSVSGPPAPTSTGTTTGLTPTVQSSPSMGAPSVPQNTMQRWQSQADGIKPLSDERRFFWATGGNKGGLIDARAPQAEPSQNKGAVQPVTFNNSPSGWEPY